MSRSSCMSLASPAGAQAARKPGVPRIQRKCAGANGNAAPAAEAPCAQCQAEAVHASGAAPNAPSPTPPAPPRPAAAGGFEMGAPDDAFEREADRLADQVMSGKPAGPATADAAAHRLQRLPASTPNLAQAPAGVQQALGTPGMPLDARTRSFFEPRFGQDFSSVRVHADDVADRSARTLDAQAYTVGHHIVFARGSFSPAAESGRRLLAHELAHVVQQSHSPGSMPALQRKGGKGPGSCGLLSAAAATVLGSAAHVQIQAKLMSRGIVPEFEIPRATKAAGVGSRKCQDITTPPGFADVARVTPLLVSLGEIKPYYIAQVAGRLEARHYRLRADQSKQRITGMGTCGRRIPGPDDVGLSLRVGGITPATLFTRISGVISVKENFGPYSQDARRDLMAKEVGGGAIGYWCVLNAAGKKDEEEEKKKNAKGKAGAGNVGIGVSINSSSVGGGNAGVGIAIDSNSAAVGTAGAGIAISSDSAAAGAAGVGATKDTMSAAAGAAGAGASQDSESVTAGSAGAGTASGSTSAGAGVAGAGKSEDSITAGAGAAGKGEVKDSMTAGAGGAGSGKSEGVVGAGKAGSPKKPIDPNDVSGPGADKQPAGEGDAEAGKSEGDKGTGGEGGKPEGEGGSSSGAGGDKEAGGGSGGGKKTSGGKSGEAGKGSGGTGGDKGSASAAGTGKDAGTGTGSAGSGSGAGAGGGQGTGTGTGPNPLGVYTVIPLGTSDAERDRIAAEAAKVAKLVQNASEAQKELLRHLSKTSPDKRFMVPASDWVQKMMNVTQGLTVEEIEYLKQLDWKPGSISEEELRRRVQKLLADRKKPSGDAGDASKSKDASDAGGTGGGKGGGKGTGTGAGDQGKKSQGTASKGTQAEGGSTGAVDRATAPPAGSNRSTAGIFAFQILSGMSPDSQLKQGESVQCRVRINDLNTGKTFDLEGVSVTFESRTETPVTINGVKFVNVKFNVYFTNDFWSEKNKFYGKGGKESTTDYNFGRRKAK